MNIEKLMPSQKGSARGNVCVCVPHFLFVPRSGFSVVSPHPAPEEKRREVGR